VNYAFTAADSLESRNAVSKRINSKMENIGANLNSIKISVPSLSHFQFCVQNTSKGKGSVLTVSFAWDVL
jgi:hypothetical protein